MLEHPDIPDEKLIVCLQVAYGLHIVHIAFLPLGQDLSTAVYRVVADDATPYFCKLRRGVFDEISVELPGFLSKQGIAHIIPPLQTQEGQLRAVLGEFMVILYPFVEGRNGYEVELTERQWADFGATLKRLHTATVPPALLQAIRTEDYAPEWRERCRNVIKRLDNNVSDEPVTVAWTAFLGAKRETVLHLVGRAEQLAQAMASRSPEFVVCHSDVHPGNLFVDTRGTLFIVDWDDPILAPKERDLMFIGGGQGFMPYIAEQEERLFYRGYGQAQLDPIALAYYRCERSITDITVESERVLSSTLGGQDRAQALEILHWYFSPGGTIAQAISTIG